MGERIAETREERSRHARKFAPAGHSTQVIVGADATNDADMLAASAGLYTNYGLSRVYYSAFSPIPEASKALPVKPPPLQRENRLYQADWLFRYYGFGVDEIASGGEDGMLDLEIDPKLAWALKNRDRFPVDVNTGEREMLLRVPGLGVRAVDRIVTARRYAKLRLEDVGRICAGLKRVRPFIIAADWRPTAETDRADLRERLSPQPRQMSLF
jgi:predicted DNA-binding helix-hairpin-helix protein